MGVDDHDTETTGLEDHDTETTGVEDHKPNNNTEPDQDHHEHADVPQRSNRIRIQNQGVGQTNEVFEYINLQGTFGYMDLCSIPEEAIVCIGTPNERKNYYNTMEFIVANKARRDQMIDNYILIQYSLKAGL